MASEEVEREEAPVPWVASSPDVHLQAQDLRRSLHMLGRIMVAVGFIGLILSATWLISLMSLLVGLIGGCTFKSPKIMAAALGGDSSWTTCPVHRAFGCASAILCCAPINLTVLIVLTLAKRGMFFQTPGAVQTLTDIGYIIGLPWAGSLFARALTWTVLYRKLAVVSQSAELGVSTTEGCCACRCCKTGSGGAIVDTDEPDLEAQMKDGKSVVQVNPVNVARHDQRAA